MTTKEPIKVHLFSGVDNDIIETTINDKLFDLEQTDEKYINFLTPAIRNVPRAIVKNLESLFGFLGLGDSLPNLILLYPETGLHPCLQSQLIKFVVKHLKDKTLYVATHSDTVFNTLSLLHLKEGLKIQCYHCIANEVIELGIDDKAQKNGFFDQGIKDYTEFCNLILEE